MKYIIIFLLFLNAHAQEIPVNKYSKKLNAYRDYKEEINPNGRTKMFINYNNTDYLNSIYGAQVTSGDIKYSFGVSGVIRYQIGKQFIGDIEGFYNLLDNKGNKISNYGADLSLGFILIPFSLKMTKVLQPYASVGYQFSEMAIVNAADELVGKEFEKATTNTSSPIWKAGLMINLSNSFFINAQYKQSFGSNKDRNFNGWSAGLGFNIGR